MEGDSPTLIMFYDVIVDMISNKKFQIVVIELFFRIICLFTKYLFGIHHAIKTVPKNVRLIITHFIWIEETIKKFYYRAILIFGHQYYSNIIPYVLPKFTERSTESNTEHWG